MIDKLFGALFGLGVAAMVSRENEASINTRIGSRTNRRKIKRYEVGGFVSGDVIRFRTDSGEFTRKVEDIDEFGSAIVNISGDEKRRVNTSEILEIKKTLDDKRIITQKIGLSEENADYLIGLSPTFAVWLADSIVEFVNDSFYDGSSRQEALQRINSGSTNVRNLREKIRLILDWLQHSTTTRQNLRELSFNEASRKASEWHDSLTAQGGDVNYEEPAENTVLKSYPEDSNGVSYYWVFIPKSYCDVESARMGHCGRTGASSLISLRSITPVSDGLTITDSHVTIAYDTDDGIIYQSKGKQNQKPSGKYFPYIFDLIKSISLEELVAMYVYYFSGAAEIILTFNGFGTEYQASTDYGFDDMTDEEIRELYEINPDVFNDFMGKSILFEAGLISERPTTTFELKRDADDVQGLLDMPDIRRDYVEDLLTGIGIEIYESGSFGYYYENASDYVDKLKDEQMQSVIENISEITGLSINEVSEIGAEKFLSGEVEDYASDDFEDIKRAIADALVSAEEMEAHSHSYKEVKEGLEEYGQVISLNDEGLVMTIDLSNYLTNKEISDYLKEYETDDLETIFIEAIDKGDISEPKVYVDSRYAAYPKDWQEYFDL
jgi:hypothetical protein